MISYTLLTGASSGIGREMAHLLAAKKHNLILVARSEPQLIELCAELSQTHGIVAKHVPYDLSEAQAAQGLYQYVTSQNWEVSGLINNAGFGSYGQFVEMDLAHDEQMIALNTTTLVGLTKLFGADMVARKQGRIMNVASILSFIPFPYYSVYSATKSFVLAFTETVAAELEGSGVSVTILCPGTVETPFHTASMRTTKAMNTNKPMSAATVAQAGVAHYINGRGTKVVGRSNWFISNLPRFVPDRLMMRIKKGLASQVA
jgi:short-subunit dehydrogenase